jgi:hypothetical protein
MPSTIACSCLAPRAQQWRLMLAGSCTRPAVALWQGLSCYRGFGNIGTESPVKPSSATIAAFYELFLVDNLGFRDGRSSHPRYGFGHRE